MIDLSQAENQIQCVTNFKDLVSTPFYGHVNALCWKRKLLGDFKEIVSKISLTENIEVLSEEALSKLRLSAQGQLARQTVLNDLKLLKAHGAAPILNVIRCYEKDDAYPFFPTDVYSYHVDRAPIPTDTFLCTYHGESSEILPNSYAEQKILVPEIREALKKLYGSEDEGFEAFLSEYFFDLHYQPKAKAEPISLGQGNLWRLAVDYPESRVLPCVHRAPKEKIGALRLLLIC